MVSSCNSIIISDYVHFSTTCWLFVNLFKNVHSSPLLKESHYYIIFLVTDCLRCHVLLKLTLYCYKIHNVFFHRIGCLHSVDYFFWRIEDSLYRNSAIVGYWSYDIPYCPQMVNTKEQQKSQCSHRGNTSLRMLLGAFLSSLLSLNT